MRDISVLTLIGFAFSGLGAIGTLYMLAAAGTAGRYRARTLGRGEAPAVTLLKPLHGDEPALAANLAGFLQQDYGGAVQMICGVQRADDPAIATVHALQAAFPDADIRLVVDSARHGGNDKISNLINMLPHARYPLLVLSDSDMAVGPAYLATITAALARPGTGAVTCLYHGRPLTNRWSHFAAAWISYQFLPSVMLGVRLGRAQPCMGSTIALRRTTLDRIGGFERFADLLADDHAIGAAVHELGLRVDIPPLILAHGCAESNLSAVLRHELRWAATIRVLDRAGYAGSIVTYPVPFALLGVACTGASPVAIALLVIALAARMILAGRIDRLTGMRSLARWLLPVRDSLSLVVFVVGFFVRSVDWRGAALRMEKHGRIAARSESLS